MPLSAGERLGPYEILAPIGAGGMGEVYRAKDTELKREVALKVLPDSFARDPERMARFQREAEVLASLGLALYSRSYTRMLLGLLCPTGCTVTVKVLRSPESSICRGLRFPS
jgi:serine/threonine protein kinase